MRTAQPGDTRDRADRFETKAKRIMRWIEFTASSSMVGRGLRVFRSAGAQAVFVATGRERYIRIAEPQIGAFYE
jgi:hypothetical protein